MCFHAATNCGPQTESLLLVHDAFADVASASCSKMKKVGVLSALSDVMPVSSWLSHLPAAMSANGIGADPVRAFTLRTSECPLLTSACSREVRNAWSSRRYSRTTANVRPTPASVESKSALSSIPQSTRAGLFGVADGEGVGLGGAVVGD